MDLDHYQQAAAGTDQFADKKGDEALMIPLLGIAGETGTLLAEFKKKIRDRESYEGFKERAEEELGDVLWYLADIATRLNLSLSEIASKNLHKVNERWPIPGEQDELFRQFDSDYPTGEQLPRSLIVRVSEAEKGRRAQMQTKPDGLLLGDPLTDNAYDDDGYRFHDVLHLANMAVLGWSPVMRALLNRKRKSQPQVDEVEDGARARVLEELIVAFVYSNARDRRYYAGIRHVDTEMLSTIKRILSHLEVHARTTKNWERAILQGYAAFRFLVKNSAAVPSGAAEKRCLKNFTSLRRRRPVAIATIQHREHTFGRLAPGSVKGV
jgi:NTP pyrophosphatase (non-canonical NTP hydrolase)